MSKLLGDGFLLELCDAERVRTTPQKYVISDLPANCTVAVAFAQKDEGKEGDYALVCAAQNTGNRRMEERVEGV